MKDEIQDISPWGNIRDVKSPIENIYVHTLFAPLLRLRIVTCLELRV